MDSGVRMQGVTRTSAPPEEESMNTMDQLRQRNHQADRRRRTRYESSPCTLRWKIWFGAIRSLSLLFLLVVVIRGSTLPPRTPPSALLGADCPPSLSNATVRVGVFYCPAPSVVVCSVAHIDVIMAIWLRHVNSRQCGLLGVGTAVEFVARNLSGTAATAEEIEEETRALIASGVDFVILPPGSLWGLAMQMLEAHTIPAIAPLSPNSNLYQCTAQSSCARANTRRFQYAHSISSPSEKYLQGWVGLLQLKRCGSLALVSTALQAYVTIVSGLSVAAADNHIPIVGRFLGLELVAGTNIVPIATVHTVIDELKRIDADAIVILASDCRPWIMRLQEVNYLPKSLATLLCTDSSAALQTLGDAINYIVGPAQVGGHTQGTCRWTTREMMASDLTMCARAVWCVRVQWDSHLTGSAYTETNATTPWAMFLDESNDDDLNAQDDWSVIEGETDDSIWSTRSSVSGPSLSSPLQFVQAYQEALNYSSHHYSHSSTHR
jgi:hypothetical protein